MTSPNHIAGGIVFTGTMLSFYNFNIFSTPLYLGVAVLFSLIPDIDTPKTVTGKLFYPIAIVINRKFGHRTITHSLLFLAIIALLSIFFSRLFHFDSVYTKIIIFSIISHFILDMVTIQGIPLFYPFRRNPCVLPSDPAFRLSTSNTRSELIAFTVFILLGFTMFPLFTQGFWTSYNRSFGTVAHCDRENTGSNNWIICDYSYTKNNQIFTDSAYILESTENKLTLFNRKEVFTLDADDKSISLSYTKPRHSGVPKHTIDVNFMNISHDSLCTYFAGRVCSGLIQSSVNVKFIDKGITYNTNFIKFSHSYDFKVITCLDTTRFDLLLKLKNITARISKDSLLQLDKHSEFLSLQAKERHLVVRLNNIPDTCLYLKNKFQNDLIEIRNKLKTFELKSYQVDLVLKNEHESILKQLSEPKPLLFSGYISYFLL